MSYFGTQFFCFLHELTEQYTKEEKDTEMEAENISNLNTSVLQSAVEATQTKDNLPLSLVGDVSKIIFEDSYPEEASADVIVDTTDGKDRTKEPMTSVNGSFHFYEHNEHNVL